MRSRYLLSIGWMFAALAPAQVASFSGPVEAFAFDLPSRSVRPVIGFPGSSSFGPAIVERLEFGSVAPQQNYAIVLQGLVWHLASHLDAARPSLTPLKGITARPQGITWSADGSTALLYSLGGNWIQSISGLPGNPAVAPPVDVSTLGGTLSAAATDAAGKQVAVAITGQGVAGKNAGVFLFAAASQSFQPLLALANPVALAFSSDSASLYAIDSATRELSVIDLASRGSQTFPLDGLADPFAVAPAPATASTATVYIASRSDRILREYNLTSRQITADLALDFAPTGFDPFGRNSFLVASREHSTDPLWLFVEAASPAVFFVPALAQAPLGAERGARR
jgi:hypothetical protein